MNKVILVGNLTADPEGGVTPNGVSVTRFSIAVNRDYLNSDNERECDFFNVTVWRGRAESCAKYLAKGKKVALVGSLQNRTYEDKDGIRRYVTDVVADEVEFLSPARSESNELPGADRYDKPKDDKSDSTPESSEKKSDLNDTKLPF